MDIRQLEYFVHVAELGSFTRAASLLSIAQPALSRQVRLLETELKQALLYRNGRGVSMTDAGKRLLEHARGILQQVDRARDELAREAGTPVGRVIVAAPPSVEKFLTVPLVKDFRGRFPAANLAMIGGLSFYIQEWLVTGRIDIGIAYNPSPSPALEIIPFLEEELFLICPGKIAAKQIIRRRQADGGALSLHDLPRHPLIIPSRPNAIRMRVETQLASLGLKPEVALEIDGVPAILDLVLEGYGYAVLPMNAIRGQPPGRFMARPFHKRLTTHLALVVPAQRPGTPLMRMTLELIREIGPGILAPKLPRSGTN
jgi:LysR family nitrogen assimilation transcriptional regulator